MLIHRVRLKNYRSIAACDVQLGELAFFVGANGAGKSNFLDALRLVTDALNTSLDHALRERGGVHEVRRRSSGHPTHFTVRLDVKIGDKPGVFAFEIGARPHGDFVVKQEQCRLGEHGYEVREGALVRSGPGVHPPAADDRLYLVNAAGLPQFRPVFDALSHMGFYNVNPDRIRELQTPDKGELLRRDGSNLASVISRLQRPESERVRRRIEEYLRRVVPGIEGFDVKRAGHMETIEFRQRVKGASDAWRFPAINMSDGTLRVLATLVAVFASAGNAGVRAVGLEEPETALHPAAAAVLRDCLMEASRSVQILVTSHSAELLDDPDIPIDSLFSVIADEGRTIIGPIDEASRSALRERLFTAGELLRTNQLNPDPKRAEPRLSQLELFEAP